jgi:O-antigen/teichoic acid export membrane protein
VSYRTALHLIAGYANVAVAAVATLVLAPIYLRLLGRADWGLLSSCLTVQAMLFAADQFLAAPLQRDSARAGDDAGRRAVFGVHLSRYLSVGIGLWALAELATLWPDWPTRLAGTPFAEPLAPVALRLALLQFLLQFANAAVLGYWYGQQRHAVANRRQALFLCGKHVLALAVLLIGARSVLAWLAVFVVVGAIELCSNLVAVRRELLLPPSSDPVPAAAAAPAASPLYLVATALAVLSGLLDRPWLMLHLDAATYGSYFLGSSLCLSLLSLQPPIQRVFLPRISTADSVAEVRAMLGVQILVLVLPCLLLAASAPGWLPLWLGARTVDAALLPTVQIHLLAVAAIAIYSPFGNAWFVAGAYPRLLRLNLAIVVVQLAVLAWATPRLGMLAGALAWAAVGGLQLVALVLVRWTRGRAVAWGQVR